MFDLDHEETREVRRDPFLVEGVRFPLLDDVVRGEMEPIRIHRFQIGVGRSGAKFRNIVGMMSMEDHEWESRLRVCGEILRKQDVRPEINVPPPESRQQIAANPNVLDEFCVGFRRDRRHFLIEKQRGSCGVRAIDVQMQGRRIQISRLARPLLALAFVGRQLEHSTVAQVKRFVAAQYGLYQVVP